jgi:hypothetical protein
VDYPGGGNNWNITSKDTSTESAGELTGTISVDSEGITPNIIDLSGKMFKVVIWKRTS